MPLPEPTDGAGGAADLAGAFAAGGSEAFAQVYDTYAQRLYTYAVGQLGSADQAADVVHDTLLLAHERIGQLRDPAKLTAWLYAICRNECHRKHRHQARETVTDDVPDAVAVEPATDAQLDAADAARIVSMGLASMSARDREVMELALRHDLDASAIADVLDVSPDNARARMSRARIVLEEGVAAALVLQEGDGCGELSSMRTIGPHGDVEVTPLVRKRMSKHLRSCQRCQVSKTRVVKAIATVTLPMLIIPLWLRDSTLDGAQLTAASMNPEVAHQIDVSRPAFDSQGWPRQSARNPLRLGAFAAAGVVVLLGGVALLNLPSDFEVGPAEVRREVALDGSQPTQSSSASSRSVDTSAVPASSAAAASPGQSCSGSCTASGPTDGSSQTAPLAAGGQTAQAADVAGQPAASDGAAAPAASHPVPVEASGSSGSSGGKIDTGPPSGWKAPAKEEAKAPAPKYTFKLPAPIKTAAPFKVPKPAFTLAPPKITKPTKTAK